MQLSAIGLPVLELDTPALLLDLDKFEHNVAKMARHLRERNVAWLPHAKAFNAQPGRVEPHLPAAHDWGEGV